MPPEQHEPLVKEQTAILKEAFTLLKDVKDSPTASAAQPRLAELRAQLTELFDREKQLGAWPKPDRKAIDARTAAWR